MSYVSLLYFLTHVHCSSHSRTGEEKILPVVAWGMALLSYTLPLLIDILIGVTVSSCLKIVSGVVGERIRVSLGDATINQ